MLPASVIFLSVVLLKHSVQGSGYSSGGEDAECWLSTEETADVSDVSETNCTFDIYSENQVLLSSCPDSILLKFLEDDFSKVWTGQKYEFKYQIITTFRPKMQKETDGNWYEVSHANMHSCKASQGFCTPWISESAGMVSHSEELWSNMTVKNGKYIANFSSTVELGDAFEGTNTFIAHARVFYEYNGIQLQYDIALAQLNVDVVVASYIKPITSSEKIFITIIYSLSVTVCAVCLLSVCGYWNHKVMVYSSPKLLTFMIVCGICAMTSAFFMRSNYTSHCSSYLLGAMLPWCAMYLTLFNKVFRVWYILRKQGKMKKRVMTEKFQAMLLVSNVTIFAGFFVLWRYTNPQDSMCLGDHDKIYVIAYYFIIAVMFMSGLYLAVQTKKFTTVFNESKHIAFAIYNCVLLFPVLELSISYVNDDLGVSWVLQVLFQCISVVSTVCIIIIPKVILILTKAEISLTKQHQRQTGIFKKDSMLSDAGPISDEVMELAISLKDQLDVIVNNHYAGFENTAQSLQRAHAACSKFTVAMNMTSSIRTPGSVKVSKAQETRPVSVSKMPKSFGHFFGLQSFRKEDTPCSPQTQINVLAQHEDSKL